MDWWILVAVAVILLAPLPWILRKAPLGLKVTDVLDLSRDELILKIAGFQKYIRILGVISGIILMGCVMSLAAGIGVFAYLATAIVVASLFYLFIEVCSEFKLLKLELCRRDIQS